MVRFSSDVLGGERVEEGINLSRRRHRCFVWKGDQAMMVKGASALAIVTGSVYASFLLF